MRASLVLPFLLLSACGGAAPEPRSVEGSCELQREKGTFDRGCGLVMMTEGRGRAKSCGKATNVSGEAHVKVMWAPDGSVASVVLDDKNPFTGTEVERCIVESFTTLRMPPFAGEKPISIGIMVKVD